MKNRNTIFTMILLGLVCLTLAPTARAVLPPPDGGYPNQNTAEGEDALLNVLTGSNNTAVGFQALYYNTGGGANTATGSHALLNNTTALYNTAAGYAALYGNTTGSSNTASGSNSLYSNTTGANNTATGDSALYSNTAGLNNTANGLKALYSNTTGANNIALGVNAGQNLTTGSNNIDIGTEGVAAESNTIRIGTLGTQTATYIAGIMGRTAPMGTPVFVNANGQLGTTPSSARFKDHIKPMDKASEAVLALKPVTFHYKKELDPQGIPQFGLVAEEVEKVNPDLVSRDAKGKVYTVRYEAVNAMLLNEFLKEHKAFLEGQRKVAQQEATISQLKSTVAQQQRDSRTTAAQQQTAMDAVIARLEAQDLKIQKVSAQFEMGKFATRRIRRGGPAPGMVLNP
jgi:uncharacterized coiled-coil protein SlyX